MLTQSMSAGDDSLTTRPGPCMPRIAPPVRLMLDAALFVDTLAGVQWHGPELTTNYRISGTDTFSWRDQGRWIGIKGMAGFIYHVACPPEAPSVDALAIQYGSLLGAVEGRFPGRGPTFQDYMRRVEAWARAYDEEAEPKSPEELDALYDDAFLRVMDPDNGLS